MTLPTFCLTEMTSFLITNSSKSDECDFNHLKANKMKQSSTIEKGIINQAPIIENEIAIVVTRKISKKKKKLREVADKKFGFIVIFFLSLEYCKKFIIYLNEIGL